MRKLFLTLAVLLFMAVIAAPPVMAVGTPYLTTISNQASATYNDANGNVMTPVVSNTVSMTVQQVFAVRVDPPTYSGSQGNELTAYYPGKLYNDGNGPDAQTFTVTTDGTSNWTPTSILVYRDVNDNGLYDAGTDTLMTASAGVYTTTSIAADGYFPIIVAVLVPDNATAPNGTYTDTRITTTSVGNTSKTATGVARTTVLAAVISISKSHTGTTYRPGDEFTWLVTMANTGTSTAEDIRATDPIPAGTTFVPNSLEVRLVYPAASIDTGWMPRTQVCSSSKDACYDPVSNSILIPGNGQDPSDTDLPAGATYYLRSRLTINAGVPVGTTITNSVPVTYTSGASTQTVNASDSIIVQQLAGVDLIAVSTNKSGNPSDQIVYAFTATNTGNGSDRINITTNSSRGWTWAIYRDVNSNGLLDGGDALLTDTNADSIIDTGLLTQNQLVNLLAVATIPANASNGDIDALTVTGTSVFDATKTDFVTWNTTVTAPILTLLKEIITVVNSAELGGTCTATNTATGAPCILYPGSVITYRVTATNSGSGNATSVIISDAIPANTTYNAGTIYTGPNVASLALKTDIADNDGGRYDGGYVIAGHTTTSPLTLGPGATWVVQFKVTVN